jgi:hypothetical protein
MRQSEVRRLIGELKMEGRRMHRKNQRLREALLDAFTPCDHHYPSMTACDDCEYYTFDSPDSCWSCPICCGCQEEKEKEQGE